MTIHFKEGNALRGFTHVYFKDGANLRQATQVYFKDGDNLRKVYDVSAPGAVPFSLDTQGLRVTVNWTPAPDNGFPITMYEVRYRDTDDTAWTDVTAFGPLVRTWTSPTLTRDEEYEFQMRAQNELGWNTWSTSQTTTITQAVPSTPGAPILRRRGSGGINASWRAPNANGSPITAYQLQYKLSSAAGWTTASSTITGTNYTVTGLTIGSTYDFRVRARNVGGWSQYSDTSSLATASSPGAPTWGNFTTATRSLTLRWTAPSSNGGSAVTGYEIEYRRGTSGSWTDGPDPGANATSRTISSLNPNTTYQFRIRAVNSVGSGTWSANKTGRTRQLVAPSAIRITTSQTWTIPNSWGDVTSIKFDIVGGSGGSGGGGGGGGPARRGLGDFTAPPSGKGGDGGGKAGASSSTSQVLGGSGGGGGGGGINGGGGGGGAGNGGGGAGAGTGESGVTALYVRGRYGTGGDGGDFSGGGGTGGGSSTFSRGGDGGSNGGEGGLSGNNGGGGGGGGAGPNGGAGGRGANGQNSNGGGGGGGGAGRNGSSSSLTLQGSVYTASGGNGGGGGGGGGGAGADRSDVSTGTVTNGNPGSNGGNGTGGIGGSSSSASSIGGGGTGGSGGSGSNGQTVTQTITTFSLGAEIPIIIGNGGAGGQGGGGGGGGRTTGASNGSSGSGGSSGYVLITPSVS